MNRAKLIACLQHLGIKPAMKTFNDRKRMQKIVYFLPHFGIDIDIGLNHYDWYLHGPYSPILTRILFDIVENPQIDSAKLTKEDTKKIESIKIFLGDDIESADSLELLVSLHFLLQQAKEFGLNENEAIEFLRKKKPYFTYAEIQHALEKVKTILN